MGIGTSMKETSLHYYRDPLVEAVSEDPEVNLRGIIIVGSPDKNEDKYLSAERVGVSLECMRADGAIFSCNGIGNNHVDYAHAIEAAEVRDVPVVALSMCPAKDFVVQNDIWMACCPTIRRLTRWGRPGTRRRYLPRIR